MFKKKEAACVGEYRFKKRCQSITSQTWNVNLSNNTNHVFNIFNKSVHKTEKSLLSNLEKKIEVTGTLVKKFKLRITVHNKSGRKKIELNEEEETWIENFLERSGITYTFPGRADTVYVGMDDSKREYKLKRYIFWKLHNSCYLFLKEMQIWSPF